jgi:alkylation response protein AidB-like acyl-CoA dehydrogenase
MTFPDPRNPYGFDAFLAWRDALDWYADDTFLQALVRRAAGPRFAAVDEAARALSAKASTRWRDLANAAALPERRPFLQHWSAHHERVDRIVRPQESVTLEREVFAEGLLSTRTDTPTRLAKMALVYQNGEACTACPLVCTEGLVGLLARFADLPQTRAMLAHLRDGRNGDYAIGAQFLTEIQGGSDVPANLVEAVPDGDAWRLAGTKFFCSVAHADYAVVTAKPRGSEAVAAFAMPMWAEGAFRERRNGYTIDRLKWKMGTSELPTAELSLDGALAYPVGALDRGLANVVAIVLTLSRLTVGIASGAYMTRAVREAEGYARFREAFGRPIAAFAMVRGQLRAMQRAAQGTLAAAFAIYAAFDDAGGLDAAGDDLQARLRALVARQLIMLHKFVASEEATDVVRSAMSIFGGNGVIEDFSCLPRLYRDSAVNELWEGPRNVLLAQVHRDLRRAAPWCPAGTFVGAVCAGAPRETTRELAAEFEALVAHPDLATPDDATIAACERWETACRRLVRAYQEAQLALIG